ncbi:MAG TPA: CoA transferase [Sneathiellales bacterium]|nr:CoA transferase [Sneathiellales bacterium]
MGPLEGIKIIEIAGIGPGPFAAMLLADMGAEVIRVDRPKKNGPGIAIPDRASVLNRGRRSIAVDLKSPEGIEVILKLVEQTDGFLEGFRPGVTERLGIGPDVCLKRNPKLIYGRMTGWGQDGPMAKVAGHDIDYIALSGVLHAIGPKDGKPTPPLNLIGDFGGGGMFLAFGLICGILEAQKSGEGQVVDAAMIEGSALLANMFFSFRATQSWIEERGSNILDGGADFYDTYETKDGKYMAVGAIEPQFYTRMLELTGSDAGLSNGQLDRENWPERKENLIAIFKTKNRDEWTELMERESMDHPHIKAREVFVNHAGVDQVAPAPRFSRTVPKLDLPPPIPGEHTEDVLSDFGLSPEAIAALMESGAVA